MTLFLAAAAEETAGAILSDAVLTIVIGLVVVFAVLLLLTGIFKLFGVVMNSLEKKDGEDVPASPAAPVAPVVAAPTAPIDLGPVMSSVQVRNGIQPEETAAIAAAVAVSMPAGQKYTITKIDRAE